MSPLVFCCDYRSVQVETKEYDTEKLICIIGVEDAEEVAKGASLSESG